MIRSQTKIVSLVLICLITFFPVFFYPFVHDDIVFVKNNPHIQSFKDWPQLFLGHASDHSGLNINTYYRPVLDIIYRLEYKMFGLNPKGWHFFNVVVHAANGVLVFYLLGLLGFTGLLPWVGGLVFLIHPIQSEAVTCVSGISNVWMGFCILAALIFYLKERYWLCFLFMAIGILSKEGAMVIFPLILLTDWYRDKWDWRKAAGLVGIAVAFLFLRGLLTGAHLLNDIFASPGELRLRVFAIGYDLMMYLRLLFLPFDLHYYRSTNFLTVSPWWWGIVAVIGYLVARSTTTIKFGFLWFVIALLPVLNVIPLVNEYSLILTSDHFLYIPMIGIVIVVIMLAKNIIQSPQWLKILFLLIVMTLTGLTAWQNTYWRNEVTLFERTIRFEPHFGRGQLLLAKAYYFNKQYTKACEHFMLAYQIMRSYEAKAYRAQAKLFYQGFIKEILFDWAHALEETGQYDLAKKKYVEAIVLDPTDMVLRNNLAILINAHP